MSQVTLFRNCRIHGLEREGELFSAMEVDGKGRITRLYAEGESVPSPRGSVDLGGAAVVPGFIDSHAHFMSKAALEALAVNLGRLVDDRVVPDCLDGARELLAARAAGGPGPVVGYGLCIGALAERRLPRARELDSWLPGREVAVFSMDGHSSSYSSPALARLRLEGEAEEGVLSGEAHEFNMGRVQEFLLSGLAPATLARGIASAVGEAAESGIVSIHCLEGMMDAKSDLSALAFRLLGGRLGPRLKLWLQYTELSRVLPWRRRLSSPRAGGCLSWEMDGSVSSRSAAFDRPYLDAPAGAPGGGRGRLYRSPEEALALVRPFYEAGWQTSAHAIGPRGIESILSAYETLMQAAGDRGNRLRLRVDHFEFPRPDQIERAGKLRLVLPVQPGFAWADARYIHSYEESIDAEARLGQSPLRSLLEAGCVPALSTDAPVQPLDPFMQVAGAVNHPVPAHRISLFQALRAYSRAGAWSMFEEGDRGTLAVGKLADFAVLDRDPFLTAPERLHDVKVLSTWHEGRRLEAPPKDPIRFVLKAIGTKARQL